MSELENDNKIQVINEYIGDGVYAQYVSFGPGGMPGVWLMTGNHKYPDNKIWLSITEWTFLKRFLEDKL